MTQSFFDYVASQQPALATKLAKVFPSKERLEEYLKEHPAANRKKHRVNPNVTPRDPDEVTPSAISKLPEKINPQKLPKEFRQALKNKGYRIEIVGKDSKRALEIARQIERGIKQSADICKLDPSVCEENLGLTRDKMPQIEGEKTVKQMLKGKPSDIAKAKAMIQAGADPESDKSIMQQMVDHLEKNGVSTKDAEIPVGKLKATQSEIQAGKVFGMAQNYLKGEFPNIDASVVVSKDNHILDGHHRWAALLTIDPGRTMKVKQIDMTMKELLKEAASLPGVYQADFKGDPLDEEKQKAYKKENKSRYGKGKKGSLMKKVTAHFTGNSDLDFDGSISWSAKTATDDYDGMMQVTGLSLSATGGTGEKTTVEMAGNITVDRVDIPASLQKVLAGLNVHTLSTVDFASKAVALDDMDLSDVNGNVPIEGLIKVQATTKKGTVISVLSGQPTITLPFKGVFHPTSYLKSAVRELQKES